MIEQCGGSTYVNKLITIGTPHEGSPFAVFQYILGALVSTDKKILYNMNTQGFYDLKPDSPFIQNLNQSGSPQLPYYTIASTNDPNALTNSKADKLLSHCSPY